MDAAPKLLEKRHESHKVRCGFLVCSGHCEHPDLTIRPVRQPLWHSRPAHPNEFTLWESVADVSACRVGRQSFVVLKLTPAVEHRLFCADIAQPMLATNRALGLDGIAISPVGLATDFDGVLATCSAYLAAARHSASPAQRGSSASSRWSPGYA
jgi:hypothetical protein